MIAVLLNGMAIALFFAALFGIALVCSKRAGRDAKDFFLSGRSMPWWLIGVSMCAASTSTNSANMFTEFIRNSGLSDELRYSGKAAAFLRGFRSIYLGIVFNVITTVLVMLAAIKIGQVLFGVDQWTVIVVTAVCSIVRDCEGSEITDIVTSDIVSVNESDCLVMKVGCGGCERCRRRTRFVFA